VNDLLQNHALLAATYAWMIAQVLKVVIHLVWKRRLNLRYLTSAGGMPSSHSAGVAALAAAIGWQDGLHSPLFALAAMFAIVVMYDAAGVRRAVSVQARLLNQIVDELFQGHPISEERLRELLGHTPIEVFVGAAFGILIAWLVVAR